MKIKSYSLQFLSLVGAAVIFMTPLTAAAQLLVNGDFENAPPGGSYTTPTGGNFADPPGNSWKVTGQSINIGTGPGGTVCQAGPSSKCVDLNGNGPGGIEQVLNQQIDIKDHRCTVNFFMSRHKQLAAAVASVGTSVNGVSTGTFNHGPSDGAPGTWGSRTFNFVGAATTNKIAFQSSMPGAAGPQIDNVTINCTPPPTGTITVTKRIINNNAGIPTPGPFEVQVKCNPNISYPSFLLTGPSFQHSINLPAGGDCKIEEVPPKAPDGCKWITTYPNGQSGKVGDKLVVQNELKCESICPSGQAEMTFPGTDVKYCCEGKPGSDKFCCNRKK